MPAAVTLLDDLQAGKYRDQPPELHDDLLTLANNRLMDEDERDGLARRVLAGERLNDLLRERYRRRAELPREEAEETAALPIPVDWDELFNRERAAEDWLVDDLWPVARQISITAPRKGRKSLLMLYIAARLAGGRDPWTDRRRDPIDVIYLDHEMTEDDLLERVEDMGHGAVDLARLHYFLHPSMPLLDQPEGGKMLVDLIDRYHAGAVVIDTFSRVVASRDYTGHEVREFYRWSAGHVKARGVGLARLDHTGHENQDRPIGTSAKGADVDVGWVLKQGEADSLTLRHNGLTRLSWVPERLDLIMRTDPLAFGRAERGWLAGTAACAADLDALRAPLDVSANAAQQLLRDAGKGRNRSVVQHAVAWRRETSQPTLDSAGTTPGTTP